MRVSHCHVIALSSDLQRENREAQSTRVTHIHLNTDEQTWTHTHAALLNLKLF